MKPTRSETGGVAAVILLICLAIISRLMPHWHNFTAVGATGLFATAYFSRRYIAFAIPMIAMFVSDLILNNIIYAHFFDHFVWFNKTSFWTYSAFAGLVVVALLLFKQMKVRDFLLASILGTLAFFLISNFGTFLSTPMYPKTPAGLISAYIAALPFALNSLLANVCYGALFVGGYHVISSFSTKEGILQKS